MTNTQANIGIRRLVCSLATPAYRNFEPNGGQLYKVMRPVYEYAGTTYHAGDVIPFDGGGGTYYTNDAQIERDFNSGDLDPAS